MSADEDIEVAAAALCSLLETADPAPDNESDRGDYFNVTPLDELFQTYGSNVSEEVEIQSSENPARDFSQESTQNTSSSSPLTTPLVDDSFHSYHTTEKRKHHKGKIDVSFKRNVHKRMVSTCKRRPTLFKKAYEFSQITGHDVFLLTQDKNGNRFFWGSGSLKDKFQGSEGLSTYSTDKEMMIKTNPDRTISVDPSPSKPNTNQTYLPSRLRNITPSATATETSEQLLSPPKEKKRRPCSLFGNKKGSDKKSVEPKTKSAVSKGRRNKKK